MAHAVFISYARDEDEKIAARIRGTLESRGIECWMAPYSIPPGKVYAEAIIDAINTTQVMVVIVSSAANVSKHIVNEIENADNRDITIIPFRIDNVALSKSLQYYLSRRHWLDATVPPIEARINELADTIEHLIQPPEEQPSAEKKRDAAPVAKHFAAEKKAHPVWFWLGLLLFVSGFGVIGYFLGTQVGSGGKANNHMSDVFAWNLPFVFTGVFLVLLSRRDIRKRWFWPGGVMLSYGIVAIPTWIYNLYTYNDHPPYPSELALAIGGFSFPFIVAGAFCLWKGWPRRGVEHPRGEVFGFIGAMLALCLIISVVIFVIST